MSDDEARCTMGAQAAEIVDKLDAWFEIAKNDTRIAGFVPWHYSTMRLVPAVGGKPAHLEYCWPGAGGPVPTPGRGSPGQHWHSTLFLAEIPLGVCTVILVSLLPVSAK